MKHFTLRKAAVLLAVFMSSIGMQAADFLSDGVSYKITDEAGRIVFVTSGANK